MKIEYRLNENDYLTFYLYIEDTSVNVRKKRKLYRFSLPVVSMTFAIYFFIKGINRYDLGYFLAGTLFLLFTIGHALLWSTITKRLSKRHILDTIRERYTPLMYGERTFVVTDDNIEEYTTETDERFAYSAVVNVVELRDYFLVRLKNASSVILPKGRTKGDDLSVVVKTIAEHAKVEILDERDWKWK